LANLARLQMSDEQKDKLGADLNKILSYVDQLNEVDVTGVEPLVSMIEKDTVLRDDEPTPSLPQAVALKNAPEKNSDYFKVPKVLG
jgi:aspartyl-tRNA(Asn)/glutamyl-tRNA(Gln) amidotransferase subunit C